MRRSHRREPGSTPGRGAFLIKIKKSRYALLKKILELRKGNFLIFASNELNHICLKVYFRYPVDLLGFQKHRKDS